MMLELAEPLQGEIPDRSEKNACKRRFIFGADEGNRTLVFSLGSCCTTIVLHPLLSGSIACFKSNVKRYLHFRKKPFKI